MQPFEHSEHDKDITCINVDNFITYPSEASCFKASIFKIIYFCFSWKKTRIQVVSWNKTSEQTQLLDLQHNSVRKFVLQNCDFWFWTIFNERAYLTFKSLIHFP